MLATLDSELVYTARKQLYMTALMISRGPAAHRKAAVGI